MLTISIVAVGKKMPDWVQQACQQYAKRIHGTCKLRFVEVLAARRGKNCDRNKIADLESARLQRAIPAGSRVIALERSGKELSTADLARRMENWMQTGSSVAMLLGGADGLPPQVLQNADEVWSLSRMTFAHPLARVILAEQVYRGYALLAGLPYPR